MGILRYKMRKNVHCRLRKHKPVRVLDKTRGGVIIMCFYCFHKQ
jgi:hypothetical protein